MGYRMKYSFAARAFIEKDALGCGLTQKASKVFSYKDQEKQQSHKEVKRKLPIRIKMQGEK